jgi:hypothetical protein
LVLLISIIYKYKNELNQLLTINFIEYPELN